MCPNILLVINEKSTIDELILVKLYKKNPFPFLFSPIHSSQVYIKIHYIYCSAVILIQIQKKILQISKLKIFGRAIWGGVGVQEASWYEATSSLTDGSTQIFVFLPSNPVFCLPKVARNTWCDSINTKMAVLFYCLLIIWWFKRNAISFSCYNYWFQMRHMGIMKWLKRSTFLHDY